jgi:hypothetical protein
MLRKNLVVSYNNLATPPSSLLSFNHCHVILSSERSCDLKSQYYVRIDTSPSSRLVLQMIDGSQEAKVCVHYCAATSQACSPSETAATAMGAHFFLFYLKLYSEVEVRLGLLLKRSHRGCSKRGCIDLGS